MKDGATKYFYSKDHLGSVWVLTDNGGAIQAAYRFDPFGRAKKLEGMAESDFGFAGLYTHARSGLLISTTRLYQPSLGIWISRDPAGGSDSAYAGNDPIGNVDPAGLDWVRVIEAPIVFGFYHLGLVVEIDDSAGDPTYYVINGLPRAATDGSLGVSLELRITESSNLPYPPVVNADTNWYGFYGPEVVDDDTSCDSESLAKRVLKSARALQKSLNGRPMSAYAPLPTQFFGTTNSNAAFGAIVKSAHGRVNGTLPPAPGYNFNAPF